jgi:non-ribosomal peptide synthase protein (TIGR01720 family)
VVQLPPKTTAFKHWAERLAEYARLAPVRAELAYWLAALPSQAARLPVDVAGGVNTEASAQAVKVMLSADETRTLLREAPNAYRAQIDDVLLTALAQTFAHWTGERRLRVDLDRHGRVDLFEDVDLSRTVGWFTTVVPVELNLVGATTPGEALQAVREQLRRIPNAGIGYWLLRCLSGDAETAARLRALPRAEVNFNYLGQFDQVRPGPLLVRLARESSGPSHSLRSRRMYFLDVTAAILEGQLQVEWSYSEHVHRRATVERLAHGFVEALRALIR